MQLQVNGECKEVQGQSLSLTELLRQCAVQAPEMVSVQLNGVFVDKARYDQTLLKQSDAVDFLYFMGGGCR